MANKSVRIKDIALKAGVSTGTVDRVIHNRGNVADDVRENVLRIINEMEYEPNLIARALGTNKVCSLGAIIPDHAGDPYWLAPRKGIEKAEKSLRSYGVTVSLYIFNPADPASFVEKASAAAAAGHDGIVISPVFYRESLQFFEQWKTTKTPFIIFNSQIAEYDPLSYIGSDLYTSGMLAGRLFHYGRPAPATLLIAHLDEDVSNSSHLDKKEKGFRNYFTQHHLDDQYEIIRAELSRTNVSAFMQQLDEIIEDNPRLSGIFVTTSKAYEIAAYLEQRHMTHICIIGYDLLPKNLNYLQKETISFLINQDPLGQGYFAVYNLAEHLVFNRPVPILKYLPLDIMTRENVGYYMQEEDEKANQAYHIAQRLKR